MSSEESRGGLAPEVEPDGDRMELTDPKAMRALAHPVRMALLELLAVRATVTATQASEALGESPANCAFHLRTLGKYGFVEEAGGGRGRERPWRAAHGAIRVSSHQLGEAQARLAARSLGRVLQERWLERARQAFATESWPEGWDGAAEGSRSLQWLTADEAERLEEDVIRLIQKYGERRNDPSRRPAGALPVEFLFFGYPVAGLDGFIADNHDDEETLS